MRPFRLPVLLLGLVVGVVGFAASPQRCLACSCALPVSPQEELARFSTVFRGRVTAIAQERSARGYSYMRVTLEATETWKGNTPAQVVVYTGSGGGDCGYPFQQGNEYLVYANNTGDSGPSDYLPRNALATGICSRTRPIAAAAEDLAALGPGRPPSASPIPGLPNTGTGPLPTPTDALAPSLLALALLASLLLGVGNLRRQRR